VKRIDLRRVKIHRNYAVDEAARVLGCHKNTIRNWLASGLEPVDDRRPLLIQGTKLREFLRLRRGRTRCHCAPGQFYCLRCRAPKHPARRSALYVPITSVSGNLKGECPDCGSGIYRRASLRSVKSMTGVLRVTFPQAQQRLEEGPGPCLDCDLEPEVASDANAQR
jgi:hypothetical protein